MSEMPTTSKAYYSPVKSLIVKRRGQMLVHSCIYYHMADNVVTDHQWQAWANELAELQKAHGTAWGFYDAQFEGWDGSSGYALPTDEYVRTKAEAILRHATITGRNKT